MSSIEERAEFIERLQQVVKCLSRDELLEIKIFEDTGSSCRVKQQKKIASPPMEVRRPAALRLESKADWDSLIAAMRNLNSIKAAASCTAKADSFSRAITSLEKDIDRIEASPLVAFEEDSAEKMAGKIVKLVERLKSIIDYLERSVKTEELMRLEKAIDDYLYTLSVGKLFFENGSPSESWINLEISGADIITKDTSDPAKKGKIFQVYIQPRVIFYINSYGEEERLNFLGRCCIYAYKDGA